MKPPAWPKRAWHPDWQRAHGPTAWRHRRRGLFLRFAAVFGLMALLVVGGMGALAFILTRGFGGPGRLALLIWIGGCGIALALPMLATLVARRAFRNIATPLADIMAAAEAVAAGDLSARVPVRRRGEFSQLAHAFNDMAQELERADQQRRNLTADVAHELRTPLQIIQGNLEGILDGVYEPTLGHLTDTLDETRLLQRLIDDLQTLSLAETGQLTLHFEPVDVAELLADIETSFSGQVAAAGVDLGVETGGLGEGETITGDADRLYQVLGNLVANALRHTAANDQITLLADSIDAGVRIEVRDTGSGIPAQDLPFVFDRFWRGDRGRPHSDGSGSGLGLAIARGLVVAHQGRIDVASEPGRGTAFTIELPRHRA